MKSTGFLSLAVVILVAANHIPGLDSLAVMSVDLSSEWLKIALVKPGVPMEIILNKESRRKTPVMVSIRNGEVQFGDAALAVGTRYPQNAYFYMQHILVKRLNSPAVKTYIKRFPYVELGEDEERGTVYFKNGEDRYYPEELLAIVLNKSRGLAEEFAEQKLKDIVITVPAFFNQAEREAVMYAAELANLKVLQLINDNAAVALNYGVFRRNDFNATPHNVMFFDMGAGSTTATIVSYQVVKSKEKGTSDATPHLFIKGIGFDRSLGGLEIDLRLRDYLARKFNEAKKTKNDVFESPRGMAKLFKEANRLKKVLSANVDHMAQVEGVLDDVDLHVKMTRAHLEEMCKDLFDRIAGPIQMALKASEMTMDEIESVILVGGGTRVPKVQERLLQVTKKSELAKNINADEAAAMGAVYQAAHLGKGFKVKKFVLKDANLYPIQVEFERLTSDDDGIEGTKVVRRTLFGRNNPFPQKKVMTFNRHTKDFSFVVGYKDLETILPEDDLKSFGPVNLTTYTLKGVETALKKRSDAEPKGIKAHFRLDDSGLLHLDWVESVFEKTETVIEEVNDTTEEQSTLQKLSSTISRFFSGSSEESLDEGKKQEGEGNGGDGTTDEGKDDKGTDDKDTDDKGTDDKGTDDKDASDKDASDKDASEDTGDKDTSEDTGDKDTSEDTGDKDTSDKDASDKDTGDKDNSEDTGDKDTSEKDDKEEKEVEPEDEQDKKDESQEEELKPKEEMAETGEEKDKGTKDDETQNKEEEGNETGEDKEKDEKSEDTRDPETTPDSTEKDETGEKTEKKEKEKKKDGKGKKKKQKTKKVAKPKVITIKENLTVEAEVHGIPKPSREATKISKNKLGELQKKEEDRLARENALNSLESFIYEMQDKLDQQEYEKCSTEEHREKLRGKLTEASDWIYEVDDDAPFTVFKDKLKELKKSTKNLEFRVKELKERPQLLSDLKQLQNVSEMFLAAAKNMSNETQIFTDVEMGLLEKAYNDSMTWYEEKSKAQLQLADTEKPVLLSEDFKIKIIALDRELRYLINKARNPPKKKDKPKKTKPRNETETGGDEDGNGKKKTNDTETSESTEKPAATETNDKSDDIQEAASPDVDHLTSPDIDQSTSEGKSEETLQLPAPDEDSGPSEETPSKEEAPTETETPTKEEEPTEPETPSKEEAPTEPETPTKEEAPTEPETPSKEEAPTETLSKEEAPTEPETSTEPTTVQETNTDTSRNTGDL